MVAYPASVASLVRPGSATQMNASGYEGDLVIDALSDEVEAIETELGTDPAGSFATVKARLAALDARAGHLPPVGDYTTSPIFRAHSAAEEISSTVANSNTRVILYPLSPYLGDLVVDQVWLKVVTAATDSGATADVGLYSSDADGLPTSLTDTLAQVGITTTGTKTVSVSPTVTITAGERMWIGLTMQSATTAGTNPTFVGNDIDINDIDNKGRLVVHTSAGGGLPSSVSPEVIVAASVPRVLLRRGT